MVTDLIASHPTPTLLIASFALCRLSLSLTPSFISQVLLLASLLLFTRPHHAGLNIRLILQLFFLWIALTVAISISRLQESIHALPTYSTAIAWLFMLSGISAIIALAPICLRHLNQKFPSLIQIVVFPTLWATMWLLVSWISPLGRLIAWSPLSGTGSYRWTRVLVGFTALDWITAAWASIVAETLGKIIFEEKPPVLLEVDSDMPKPTRKSSGHLVPLTGILLVLAVPSFSTDPLPLSPFSSRTTPLRVACVLPENSEESRLEHYLADTRSYSSSAKILLWPETAVVFETQLEKNQTLEEVQKITGQYKVWVGVSFEESVNATGSQVTKGSRRNGMSLIGPDGVEWTYYKRSLIPIVESAYISSSQSPLIHTIDLPPPPHAHKDEWGNRTIPLSASIGLDFSKPLTSLVSRPALVLAPAKTWDIKVGRAMYELARARGEEIGAEVLWCDGGAGGVSGVAGDLQVGKGTWVKTIGVPYPVDAHRTVYGACGDWLALAAMWLVPALIWVTRVGGGRIAWGAGPAITWAKEHVRALVAQIQVVGRRGQRATAPAQENEPLIDTT